MMTSNARDRGRDRAARPVPVPVVIALVAMTVALAAFDASAQSPRNGAAGRGSSELWIEPSAFLEPVTSFDFEGAASGLPERASPLSHASLSSTGAIVTGFVAPPNGSPVTVVRRELDGLWRLRTRGGASLPYTRVDYDVVGANGERGVLSHVANDRSMIAVRVIDLPARQVGSPNNGLGILEGGVMLEMDLGQALEAGRYEGSLRVTIVQL